MENNTPPGVTDPAYQVEPKFMECPECCGQKTFVADSSEEMDNDTAQFPLPVRDKSKPYSEHLSALFKRQQAVLRAWNSGRGRVSCGTCNGEGRILMSFEQIEDEAEAKRESQSEL